MKRSPRLKPSQEPKPLPAPPDLTPAATDSAEQIQEEVEVLPPEEVDDISVEDFDSDDEPGPAESGQEKRVKDIVPYDSLSAYLREIQRYPMLSKEEERALAIKYLKEGDLQAAYKLVSSNLWLVVKIARDYERAVRSLLDLIQEGNIGLMEAVKNFDPYRGVRFPSYAAWWIKAYIIRYVIANWRLVKIGTTQAQRKLFFNLKKEKEKLEREGFFAGPKLLAEKLNVKESEVVEMEQRLGASDVSVDAPMPDNPENTLLSVLSNSDSSAEDLLAKKQMRQLLTDSLEEFASTLKPKELIIFRQRMLGEEKATLQDVSEQLNVSRERVRQIENRIREKLKDFLLQKLGPSVETFEFES